MITCKFVGELGNNLFQLATLVSISKKYGYKYCVPQYRKFWNSHNNPNLEFNELFTYKFPYEDSPEIYNHYIHPDRLHDENYTHRFVNLPEISDGTSIEGYFQSIQYFENVFYDLKHRYFEINHILKSRIYERYPSIWKSAVVHVRHGRDRHLDCIYGKSFYQLEPEYYHKAIQYIKTNFKIDNFYVISDDIEWAKNNILEHVIFVENTSNIEDFTLMSLSKYNILSNSTFSWWASILNNNDRPVRITFPYERYFYENSALSNVDVRDLYRNFEHITLNY